MHYLRTDNRSSIALLPASASRSRAVSLWLRLDGHEYDAGSEYVFGNALGNSIVEKVNQSSLDRTQKLAESKKSMEKIDATMDKVDRLINTPLGSNPDTDYTPGTITPDQFRQAMANADRALARESADDAAIDNAVVRGDDGKPVMLADNGAAFAAAWREAQSRIDPETGRRIGPTPENAKAAGLNPNWKPEYPYDTHGVAMVPWDGKTAPVMSNAERQFRDTPEYAIAMGLHDAPALVLPELLSGKAGAFVAGQFTKAPIADLGASELLRGARTSGLFSAGTYLAIERENATPAGVAVAFGAGAVGGGLVKQSLNYWAALPNTAIPISYSNFVTQAAGSAYGFGTFKWMNTSGLSSSQSSWLTTPISLQLQNSTKPKP